MYNAHDHPITASDIDFEVRLDGDAGAVGCFWLNVDSTFLPSLVF